MNIKKIILITIGSIFIFIFLLMLSWNILQVAKYVKDTSERTFMEFQELEPEEFHIKFHRKHFDSVYKLDCKIQYDEWNCSVAVWGMLIDLGANLDFKNSDGVYINTDEIHKLLKLHSYKVKSPTNIKGKEIVIFKRNGNDIPHVAITERVNYRRRILIMEMNTIAGGVNYRWIKFNDWRIEGIYPVTLGLWRGE